MELRSRVVLFICCSLQLGLTLCANVPVSTSPNCQQPSPPRNGNIQLNEDWLKNKLAVFACDAGYVLIGPEVLYCLGNSWNDTEPICATKDCVTHYKSGLVKDGVYGVIPDGATPQVVYCDMTTAGGGWTVFQRRVNSKITFYQDWDNYKQGFGEVQGNFWLGLETLHQLTADDSELYIYMEAELGDSRYARYGTFSVGAEGDNYRLIVANYSGTAGDSLGYHNRQMFTTKDKDNDNKSSGNCAKIYRGAWWYDSCYRNNLNGVYLDGKYTGKEIGITWNIYKGDKFSLKYVKMMLRRKVT